VGWFWWGGKNITVRNIVKEGLGSDRDHPEECRKDLSSPAPVCGANIRLPLESGAESEYST